MPAAIKAWPTLPPAPLAASIQPPKRSDNVKEEAELDETDSISINSILIVADSSGSIQCFLDGTYPLGTVSLDSESTTTTVSLQKPPFSFEFRAFQKRFLDGSLRTPLLPTTINLTLLASRIPRDIAKVSSAACQLLWYAIRVVDDLKGVWIGSNTRTGAREPGMNWLMKLQETLPAGCMCSVLSTT
jgi:anaphase-promoting complex subunit 4